MIRPREWIRRFYTHEGFRGPVVTLLSGTALTLGASYLAVPILTRLFTPAEFGVSDYFVMVASILTTFASLRYEDALMLPEDDERAGHVFWLALLLTLATVVVVAILSFWGPALARFLHVPEVAPWLWLLAPALLLMRFGKLSELWLARQRAFRTITGGDVANKGAMIAGRIGSGAAMNAGAGGLIGGFVLGHIVSSIYYTGALWRRAHTSLGIPRRGLLRATAVRYRRFAIFSTPSSVLNGLVARLPVLLLPVFFGMDVVGLFGRAFTALAVPLSLIGTAVSQVFFVHAAEAHRSGSIADLTEAVHARLVMIGMFPTVALVVAAPNLFAFVFGSDWRVAGVFEQYLAFWFFLAGVASPLTRVFDVMERQRTELIISIVTSLVLTAALVIGGRAGDVFLTMMLVGVAGVLIRLLQIGTMMRLSGVPLGRAVRPYIRYLLFSIPLAIPLWLLRDGRPWVTASAAALAGVVYLAVVIWRDRLLADE